MKYAYIYVFVVLICLTLTLRTINVNSVDNLITSIAPSIFELSCNINDDYVNEGDIVNLDQEKFKLLLTEEIKNNKSFYQGEIYIEFYFYNVITNEAYDGMNVCNGVQFKITFKSFYMFNKVKEYRYEVVINEK